ncbi:hypothetical protein BHM03_00032796, partial [Ensete ventricosum]
MYRFARLPVRGPPATEWYRQAVCIGLPGYQIREEEEEEKKKEGEGKKKEIPRAVLARAPLPPLPASDFSLARGDGRLPEQGERLRRLEEKEQEKSGRREGEDEKEEDKEDEDDKYLEKKREKKRENLEIQHCSPNLDPLPVGFSVLRRENLQRSQGEGPMRGLLIEASQGDFFSLRRLLEEKTFLLPTWGEETSLRAKR